MLVSKEERESEIYEEFFAAGEDGDNIIEIDIRENPKVKNDDDLPRMILKWG